MSEQLKVFATRLRALRKEHKLTQEELSQKIGCSPALISFYETMLREPGLTNILLAFTFASLCLDIPTGR